MVHCPICVSAEMFAPLHTPVSSFQRVVFSAHSQTEECFEDILICAQPSASWHCCVFSMWDAFGCFRRLWVMLCGVQIAASDERRLSPSSRKCHGNWLKQICAVDDVVGPPVPKGLLIPKRYGRTNRTDKKKCFDFACSGCFPCIHLTKHWHHTSLVLSS